jgi:retinol dehydrogenase 12
MSEHAPSLTGRVALITGANTGIGLVTARELARRGARVFIACRSRERGEQAADTIRAQTGHAVELLELDLGDFESVRRCAAEFLAKDTPLHLLINNAGLAGKRGMTRSGFELTFGVNHMGHFLLTQLLLERIKRSAPARIVTVSSQAHYRVRGLDLDTVRRPTRFFGLREYGESKLANVLFSAELARKLEGTGVTTYSLHPGVIASEIWREVPKLLQPILRLRGMLSVDDGALTTLYCATAPELARETGLYYSRSQAKTPSGPAQDRALAAELWKRSEQWVQS